MAEAEQSSGGVSIAAASGPLSRNRPATTVAIVLGVVVLVLAALFYWQKKAPPLAARLLPESDAVVYVNVAPLRAATLLSLNPVKHDLDYQRFIDATGIQFERDLKEAAFSLHRMDNPLGPNGPVAYSSIFVGKFDRTRLSTYLARVAQSREQYAGHDIYDIPVEGRTDRVAILTADVVAVSNTPSAEQIHSILDRNRTAALLPFSSNTLLSRRYAEVPAFSLAWGLGKLGLGLGNDFTVLGFKLPLSVDATFIASLRWAGSLHLRIEEIAPNETAAVVSADSLQALLSIFRTAANALPNAVTTPEAHTLLDSIEIEHHNDRTVLTAAIPVGLLRKMTTDPDGQIPSP